MPKFLDFLRKMVPGWPKGRHIVKVHNEKVDIGEATVADRRIDLSRPLGIGLLVVALSIYVGIFDLVGLSVPIVIGHLALAFGLLFAREWLLKIVKWGKVTVSVNAKAKAVPSVKKRVIRAGDEKKPKAEESGQEGASIAEWDVFICHASEDKEDFVRSLAEGLEARGLKVWYDDFTLTVGDSLRRSIDHGLAHSRFGVVVISPNFMRKEWPQMELDGLVAREVAGVKVILPVWHGITADEVRAYSPTLADRVATPSDTHQM